MTTNLFCPDCNKPIDDCTCDDDDFGDDDPDYTHPLDHDADTLTDLEAPHIDHFDLDDMGDR